VLISASRSRIAQQSSVQRRSHARAPATSVESNAELNSLLERLVVPVGLTSGIADYPTVTPSDQQSIGACRGELLEQKIGGFQVRPDRVPHSPAKVLPSAAS
jgi:hypothetical protein